MPEIIEVLTNNTSIEVIGANQAVSEDMDSPVIEVVSENQTIEITEAPIQIIEVVQQGAPGADGEDGVDESFAIAMAVAL